MDNLVTACVLLYSVVLFLWGVAIGQFMSLRAHAAGKTPDLDQGSVSIIARAPSRDQLYPVHAPTATGRAAGTIVPRVSKSQMRSAMSGAPPGGGGGMRASNV
jgi:hypothetical protein